MIIYRSINLSGHSSRLTTSSGHNFAQARAHLEAELCQEACHHVLSVPRSKASGILEWIPGAIGCLPIDKEAEDHPLSLMAGFQKSDSDSRRRLGQLSEDVQPDASIK